MRSVPHSARNGPEPSGLARTGAGGHLAIVGGAPGGHPVRESATSGGEVPERRHHNIAATATTTTIVRSEPARRYPSVAGSPRNVDPGPDGVPVGVPVVPAGFTLTVTLAAAARSRASVTLTITVNEPERAGVQVMVEAL